MSETQFPVHQWGSGQSFRDQDRDLNMLWVSEAGEGVASATVLSLLVSHLTSFMESLEARWVKGCAHSCPVVLGG